MDTKQNCLVWLDGQLQEDIYDDIIALEVAERDLEPSTFVLKLAVYIEEDGSWSRLDEVSGSGGSFTPWQRVTICLGSPTGDVLIDGYVAGIAPHIGLSETDSYLLVWGYDASYAMSVEEKVVAWPNQKYSDVARKLFAAYGLDAEVVDTKVVYPIADDLLLQRGTDWDFISRMAKRVGFEAFVRGAKGYFRPPDLRRPPQMDLAVCFGDKGTNLLWFEPQLTANQPGKVSMARVNAAEKTVEKIDVTTSPLKQLGAKNATTLRGGRNAAGQPALRVPPQPVSSAQAMEALAKGLRADADWIVSGEGEADGILYGQALRAHEPVLIKGIGHSFSGVYYVTEVIHRFTDNTYRQLFKVVRNGVGLTGSEPFHDVKGSPGNDTQGSDLRVRVSTGGRMVSP